MAQTNTADDVDGVYVMSAISDSFSPLKTSLPNTSSSTIRLVANFGYAKPRLERFIHEYQSRSKLNVEKVSVASALKFIYLLEGKADFYPKLGPIMQWDIAAGYALLSAIGIPFKNLDGSELTFMANRCRQDGFYAGHVDTIAMDLFQTLDSFLLTLKGTKVLTLNQ